MAAARGILAGAWNRGLAAMLVAFALVAGAAWGQGRAATDTIVRPGPRVFVPPPVRAAGLAEAFPGWNRRVVAAPDVERLLVEDRAQGGIGPRRIGVIVPVEPVTMRDGVWTKLPDGRWAWTFAVQAPGAKGIRLGFHPWRPRPGAELVVWNAADPGEARGPMAPPQGRGAAVAWALTIYGEEVRCEYVLPPGVEPDGAASDVGIESIGYQYVPFSRGAAQPGTDELPCHLDVSCYTAWQIEADGVGAVAWVSGPTMYFCTGAMVNRTPGDLANLFATAYHCGITIPLAALSAEITWFYQTTSCNGTVPNPATLPKTQGSAYLAGDFTTDWTLLGLRNENDTGVSYVGWDANALATYASVTGIHHPDGTHKRISMGVKLGDYGSRPPSSGTSCQSGTAHYISWSQGLVEPGSSGSPIFDASHRMRGVLSCGSASCSASNHATYGRLDQAWSIVQPFLQPADPIYANAGFTGTEKGTVSNPFNTVLESSFAVIAGSDIYVQAGTYVEGAITLDRRFTMHSQGGVVTVR